MYYKISKSETLVDVFDKLEYVRYSEKSNAVLLCNEDENPFGVLSNRRDSYYQVEGWTECPIPCQEVALETISESEYLELKKKLDDEDKESEVVTELRNKITSLEYENEVLEGAIRDIGEIIGG